MIETFIKKIKKSYKSFTNWFNVAGLAYLQAMLVYPDLVKYLNENNLVVVLIIGNIIIRIFKTKSAIEDK